MESRISKNSISTKKLVELGILTALVIILQLLGLFIRFGTFSVSLVLVPVVLGGALLGARQAHGSDWSLAGPYFFREMRRPF